MFKHKKDNKRGMDILNLLPILSILKQSFVVNKSSLHEISSQQISKFLLEKCKS